jgi:uncharacterized membrane protein
LRGTGRDLAKTASFAALHFAVGFGVSCAFTGSIVVAGGIALFEPLVDTLVFQVHERTWNRPGPEEHGRRSANRDGRPDLCRSRGQAGRDREVSFENPGRSRVMFGNRGLLRVCADGRNGRFPGAGTVGPRAAHLGHLLAWAHEPRLTIAGMPAMPFCHPVVEESLRAALRDACRQPGDCTLRAA